MKLDGRRILVTGAGSGIGKATALAFAREGARLALLDIDRNGLAETAALIAGAVQLPCDIADYDATAQAANLAVQRLGGLDGLVNAAGIDLIRDFGAMTPADWQRVLTINLTGTMFVCHAAVPALERHPGATIVNLASGAGLSPLANRTAYCTAKAGVVMFSKALALELAPKNIRVNVVCPGAIDTPMLRSGFAAAADPAAMQAQVSSRAALGRIGRPEDIASAVLFLTCAASDFTTGSALVVDGGRVFH
jgi:NAD(P)-dependent dehydrogenase (short-subunit alcohol dehydrogenase family)